MAGSSEGELLRALEELVGSGGRDAPGGGGGATPGVDGGDAPGVEGREAPGGALLRAFDDAYTAYIAALASLPGEGALECLQQLDSTLSVLAEPGNAALLAPDAVRDHPHWDAVRGLAAAALAHLAP